MKTVCIVQARMGSKRLPGKVLLPLNGHTVIGEALTRCKQIAGIDEVVCAIPIGTDSLPLSREAYNYCNVWVSSLPENDVLGRYKQAADAYGADIIMRVTGDCPLISSEICAEVLSLLIRCEADYASNVQPRTFPQGYDCEVFTRETLERAQGPDEHVTTWMRNAHDVKRANLYSPWKMDGRLCLDTEDDYKVICAAFGHEPYKHLRAA